MKFGGKILKHDIKNTLPSNLILIENNIINLNDIKYVDYCTPWKTCYVHTSKKYSSNIRINAYQYPEEYNKMLHWLKYIQKKDTITI